MKKKIFILIAVIALTLFAVGAVACDDESKDEQIGCGVYLPVGAETSENGEIPSDWVAVIDDKMTLSLAGEIKVYDLNRGNEGYNADSADSSLSVVAEGDTLTVDNKGKKTEYVLSERYAYSGISKESLIPVLEPEIRGEGDMRAVSLEAKYEDLALNGIKVEIKTSDSGEYESFDVVQNEDGIVSVIIPFERFSGGDNYIRLSNSQRYPMIDGGKNLFMKTESGSIEYKVTSDENGNITYLQNDTASENGVYEFAYSDEPMSSEEKDHNCFVVIDGMLTESFKGGRSLYYLSDVDDVYSMKLNDPDNSAVKTFTVKNGIITVSVKNSGKVYQLKKDDSYEYSEEKVKLEKPADPECGVENYDFGQQIWFRFFAPDTSYPVGVKVEIKRAGSETYEFYDTDVPYRAEIYVDGIGADKLAVGANYVRICNVGAPVATSDKRFYMAEDSDWITFEVVLYDDGALNKPYVVQE